MIRDVSTLCDAIENGLQPKWVLFWGHKPAADGSVSKSCFSQWWEGTPFEVDGVSYVTAEHFMMAEKARLFQDDDMEREILASRHPGEAKKLGRKVRAFDAETWNRERFEIVVRGNLGKFGQHEELREFLLGTGDRVLVEASPRDRIWGIGLSAKNADAERPENWRGLNLLGFALMEVRHRLARELDAA